MLREKPKRKPREARVPMQGTGTDGFVVVLKFL
jgi:hypothetical protein